MLPLVGLPLGVDRSCGGGTIIIFSEGEWRMGGRSVSGGGVSIGVTIIIFSEGEWRMDGEPVLAMCGVVFPFNVGVL